MGLAVAVDLDDELGRQRIDHRRAHAVQAARGRVGPRAELSAGVEFGEHVLERGSLAVLDAGGNASAVVADLDGPVLVQGDLDEVGEPGGGLVDRVVDQLPHQVVQAFHAGAADVHAGALANRVEAFEDLDRVFVVGVGVVLSAHGGFQSSRWH